MYYKSMEYTNETLAELIIKFDNKSEEWVYNRHCEYCGKFLYPEETKHCKKCKTTIKNPVKRAIPFLNSATAIEKLILWVRRSDQHIYPFPPKQLLSKILNIINDWAASNRSADAYKLEIVIACVNMLLQ